MKEFDPKKYLNLIDKQRQIHNTNTAKSTTYFSGFDSMKTVEAILEQLEIQGIDITANYDDWIKIGFAFADEFGQQGSDFFHRASKIYPAYDYKTCQKQFESCLKGDRKGVTLGTFFHFAKQAGIELASKKYTPLFTAKKVFDIKEKEEQEQAVQPLAEFPVHIFEQLPAFLQKVIPAANNNAERDMLLLGALTVMSSSLPNVYGIYDQFTVYPNLFLFITAPASSGKGRVNLCRRLVHHIHSQKRSATCEDKIQYEIDLAAFNEQKKKDKTITKPSKPPEQMLFIPANSSATGTFQLLADNN